MDLTAWDRDSEAGVQAANVLQAVGLLTGKETNEQQIAVMLKAFDIFLERNEDRRDLWAEFDMTDALLHIRSKSARLERLRKDINDFTKKDLDEAYDLINYCVFFIRHVLGWVPELEAPPTQKELNND